MSISSKATSGNASSFDASVKRVAIGAVPDRGGRSTAAAATARDNNFRKRARG
jgi:hypothetical protein